MTRRAPTRRQTPEGAVVRQILDGLHVNGIPAWKLNSGAFAFGEGKSRRYFQASWRGAPDIVALLDDGRTLWVEAKSARGRLSLMQQSFRDLCRRRGVPWVLARSWEDVAPWVTGEAGRKAG